MEAMRDYVHGEPDQVVSPSAGKNSLKSAKTMYTDGRSLWVGSCQPLVELAKRIRRGDSWRQSVPANNGAWEERIGVELVSGSLLEETVSRPGIATKIQFLVDVNQCMLDPVQHQESCLLSALLEGVPFQSTQHGCHAARCP